MRYQTIPADLFVQNRKNLLKKLPDNSIVILAANIEYPRNGDQYYPFRQDSDFFYLCGLNFPAAVLVIEKSGGNLNEILFTQETNEHIMLWQGPRPDKLESKKISGIQDVRWLDEFGVYVLRISSQFDHFYLNLSGGRRMDTNLATPVSLLVMQYPDSLVHIDFEDICPEIHALRTVKSESEIQLIRKAIQITKDAYFQVLKAVEPEKFEYQIEACLRHEMLSQAADEMSFAPIVASGKNACVLHYVHNDGVCKDGDLLLMDFGAEYANYAADCSRTFPVNGKYSPRQAQIYQAVLDVFYEAQKLFKPGNTIQKINDETGQLMQEKLLEIGLLSHADIEQQSAENPAYKRYFPHGTTHFMGLDVHDVGAKQDVLKLGMVLTCEPGIYIREEGIGVRIETDMLITENGSEDLMKDFPIEIKQIEDIMNS